MLAGLAAYNSSSSEEEENSKPAPQVKKMVKQKKKILVPQSEKLSSDEDDEPVQKKPNLGSQNKTGSGLFAKLPAPRNTIGDGKQTNRTFVPYVFSKKPEQKKVTKVTVSKTSVVVNDADSSGDETEVKFFSFVEKQPSETTGIESSEASVNLIPSSTFSTNPIQSTHQLYSAHDIPAAQVHSSAYHQTPTLSMGSSVYNSTNSSSFPQSASTCIQNETGAQHNPHNLNHTQAVESNLISQPTTNLSETGDSQPWQQDDRFKRLQGKSNRREKVEFIEIQADKALEGNKELLLKQISEEKNLNRMSHSKKKNKDMPSSQSKRKHQMSYLIHQAKAREIELKNSWADGHAARDAARNRYGF